MENLYGCRCGLVCKSRYEIVQDILAIGRSDITDLIGNTLGGIIGIGLFVVIKKILDKNTVKIINVLATIGTVFIVIFLSYLRLQICNHLKGEKRLVYTIDCFFHTQKGVINLCV